MREVIEGYKSIKPKLSGRDSYVASGAGGGERCARPQPQGGTPRGHLGTLPRLVHPEPAVGLLGVRREGPPRRRPRLAGAAPRPGGPVLLHRCRPPPQQGPPRPPGCRPPAMRACPSSPLPPPRHEGGPLPQQGRPTLTGAASPQQSRPSSGPRLSRRPRPSPAAAEPAGKMAALAGLRALRRLCGVALFLAQLYVLSGRGERGCRRFARAPRGRDGAVGRGGRGSCRLAAAPRAGRALGARGPAAPQRLPRGRGLSSRASSAAPRGRGWTRLRLRLPSGRAGEVTVTSVCGRCVAPSLLGRGQRGGNGVLRAWRLLVVCRRAGAASRGARRWHKRRAGPRSPSVRAPARGPCVTRKVTGGAGAAGPPLGPLWAGGVTNLPGLCLRRLWARARSHTPRLPPAPSPCDPGGRPDKALVYAGRPLGLPAGSLPALCRSGSCIASLNGFVL